MSSAVVIAKAYSDDRKVVPDRLPIHDEKTLFEKGLKAAEAGKDQEALDLLTRVLAQNNRHVGAYIIRAQVFQKLSLNQEALKDYDSVIKLMKDPKELGHIYGMRAELYNSLRQFPQAIADFTKSIELNPEDLQALFLRGNSHYLTGRYDDAISDFALILKKKPDDIEALYKMGNAYANRHEFAEAIRLFDKVTSLDPTHAFAMYSRAQAYYCIGAYEKALEEFQKCMKAGLYDEYCRIWTLVIMKQIKAEGYDRYAEEFKKYIATTRSEEWVRFISRYLLDLYGVTEAEVMAEARKPVSERERDARLCEAYFFLAVKSLQGGDTQGAAILLQKTINTGVYEFYEYVTTGVLLKAIKVGGN